MITMRVMLLIHLARIIADFAIFKKVIQRNTPVASSNDCVWDIY